MNETSEIAIDRTRLTLAALSAVSVIVFGVLRYRLLLAIPLTVTIYLAVTAFNLRAASFRYSWRGTACRLGAAYLLLSLGTVVYVNEAYTMSDGAAFDLVLIACAAVLIFAAILYRVPNSKPAWARHLMATASATALAAAALTSALYFCALRTV